MGTQGYRANYREAFECANTRLDGIYNQYHQLQLRKEQLEGAVAALQPFLQFARMPEREDAYHAEPVRLEAVNEPEPVPEPILYAAPVPEPMKQPVASEPIVAPSYSPVSEANLDPIQARINRALGLAVA